MFTDVISLRNTIANLEAALFINHDDEKVERTIDNAVKQLSDCCGVNKVTDIFQSQAESVGTVDKVGEVLANIKRCLADMSFLTSLTLYHKNICLNLADVNYLGMSRVELNNKLRYLQDHSLAIEHPEVAPSLEAAVDMIPMCHIKRIMICMLVLNRIGVTEGTSICAQFLLLGGLVI